MLINSIFNETELDIFFRKTHFTFGDFYKSEDGDIFAMDKQSGQVFIGNDLLRHHVHDLKSLVSVSMDEDSSIKLTFNDMSSVSFEAKEVDAEGIMSGLRPYFKENAAKEDAVKEDTAIEDTVKEDTIEEETIEEDTAIEDTVKENAAKEDAVKENAAKEDAVKEDAVKEDAVKEDTAIKDTAIKDTVKEDTAKEDTIEEETIEENVAKEQSEDPRTEVPEEAGLILNDKELNELYSRFANTGRSEAIRYLVNDIGMSMKEACNYLNKIERPEETVEPVPEPEYYRDGTMTKKAILATVKELKPGDRIHLEFKPFIGKLRVYDTEYRKISVDVQSGRFSYPLYGHADDFASLMDHLIDSIFDYMQLYYICPAKGSEISCKLKFVTILKKDKSQ